MANHKDALKRIRQNKKRRARNRQYRSQMRNRIKRIQSALSDGDLERAEAQFSQAVSIIQRTAQKGVIHKKQAARRVSRLSAEIKRHKIAIQEKTA
ncbi:MAG: 30S ribosomal protein S20 [Myxococcota bacterium]